MAAADPRPLVKDSGSAARGSLSAQSLELSVVPATTLAAKGRARKRRAMLAGAEGDGEHG